MSFLRIVDSSKELLRWGPVPAWYFYMSDFCEVILHSFPKKYAPHVWPNSIALFCEGRLTWINEKFAIEKAGEDIFLDCVVPEDIRHQHMDAWRGAIALLRVFQERLTPVYLRSLSSDDLLKNFDEFYRLLNDAWLPTIAPELGNYGSSTFLEKRLKDFGISQDALSHVLETLTAPDALSFYQEEEIALANTQDISAHTKNYFWLKNSYGHVECLLEIFFIERKKVLAQDVRAVAEKHLQETRERRGEIVKQYALSDELVSLATALREAIIWQDARKRQILESLAYKKAFLEEIAFRFSYDLLGLLNLHFKEIRHILLGDDMHTHVENRRFGHIAEFGWDALGNVLEKNSELSIDDMKRVWDEYLEEKVDDHSSFMGIVACKGSGIVRARVKVFLRPENFEDFPEGSVLVAPMTSPEYVFAMKRASAILTDTGGLTSHAAIVSRELKVSCLVGTKVATQVLKDGDLVEVDAEKGIVRKIS